MTRSLGITFANTGLSTPAADESSMSKKLFVLTTFLFTFLFAQGQVPGKFTTTRSADGLHRTIEVTWDTSSENQWKNDNEGRLDIMAVRVDIPSVLLSGLNTLNVDDAGSIELLIEITTINPGQQIILRDVSGKDILVITDPTPKKILTPSFDPRTTRILIEGGSPDFIIRSIYLNPNERNRNGQIGFNTALACHPNAACKQDSLMKLISFTAVRIRMVMEEGIGWCTGSFVNNTRNDKTPYLLTAHHCTFEYTPKYDLWRFDFQFASPSCENPAEQPEFFSMTGCEFKATGQGSDFLLVKLFQNIPLNQEVTFAGWNNSDSDIPDTTYLVHHPNADMRKLSTCTNKSVIHPNQIGWSEGYTTPPNHHFRFKFTEGGHQAGSSGGPVFNEDGLLIGQLHGGTMGCEAATTAFVGRFSKSWNTGATAAERLQDWLDPDQTNVTSIDAITNIARGELVDLSGIIKDPYGKPVKNVQIEVTGDVISHVTTDQEGRFVLNAISRNGQYHIVPSKNDNPLNGLNVLDLVRIQKHLLGRDDFDLPWQYIAADATNNQEVSVGDILLLLRLVLGKITQLPSSPSWRFEPASLDVTTFPATGPLEVEMKAIKIGDLNGTADPAQ